MDTTEGRRDVYEIIRPGYDVRQADGTMRHVPEERRTFLTGAGMLRWALDARMLAHHTGGVPYPTRFDDKWLGEPGRSTYGMIDTFCRWRFTPEHLTAMQRAAKRYREIFTYLREVEPEWRPDTDVSPTGEIRYADNSTVLYEVSKYGHKRFRTLVAPSGDACF
jgi:hypothetical protein